MFSICSATLTFPRPPRFDRNRGHRSKWRMPTRPSLVRAPNRSGRPWRLGAADTISAGLPFQQGRHDPQRGVPEAAAAGSWPRPMVPAAKRPALQASSDHRHRLGMNPTDPGIRLASQDREHDLALPYLRTLLQLLVHRSAKLTKPSPTSAAAAYRDSAPCAADILPPLRPHRRNSEGRRDPPVWRQRRLEGCRASAARQHLPVPRRAPRRGRLLAGVRMNTIRMSNPSEARPRAIQSAGDNKDGGLRLSLTIECRFPRRGRLADSTEE